MYLFFRRNELVQRQLSWLTVVEWMNQQALGKQIHRVIQRNHHRLWLNVLIAHEVTRIIWLKVTYKIVWRIVYTWTTNPEASAPRSVFFPRSRKLNSTMWLVEKLFFSRAVFHLIECLRLMSFISIKMKLHVEPPQILWIYLAVFFCFTKTIVVSFLKAVFY